MRKECQGWNTTCRQEWNLFLLEWMGHNTAAMWCKEHQRCSQGLPLEPTETAPEHPSVQTLIGSHDSELLQVMEQIYKGEYAVAPSVFTHAQHEHFMRELQWKLSGCMTRPGLWSKRGPAELPSRNWRCSQGPVEGDQACEVKWQNGWSKLRRRWTQSRGRSGLRQCQSPSSACPSQHQSSSPSPPWSCPADKWLHCSMENLQLQPRSQESKSRTQWCYASLQAEENPRKQVQFKVDEELGDEPSFPSDLTLFLTEGAASKWSNAPSLPANCPPPPRAPSTAMTWQEGPVLKFQLYYPMVNPAFYPKQGQEERDLILWNTHGGLVEAWYSLEQYIGFWRKTSFHPLLWTSSGLKGTWKLSAYVGLGSLRCAKSVKTRNN